MMLPSICNGPVSAVVSRDDDSSPGQFHASSRLFSRLTFEQTRSAGFMSAFEWTTCRWVYRVTRAFVFRCAVRTLMTLGVTQVCCCFVAWLLVSPGRIFWRGSNSKHLAAGLSAAECVLVCAFLILKFCTTEFRTRMLVTEGPGVQKDVWHRGFSVQGMRTRRAQ